MAPEKPTETKPVKYDTEPCSNCGTLAVKTEVVHGDPINPPATLDGKSLSEGDKAKVCDACGAILTKVSAPKKSSGKKKSSTRKRSTSKRSSSSSSTSRKSTAKASSSKK